MTTTSPPPGASARTRTVLVASVVLLAASAVGYAAATASSERTDFVAAGPPETVDGKVRRTYVLPEGTAAAASGTVMGAYRFPQGSGDVYVLGCRSHADFLAGRPLGPDSVALRGVREGMFHQAVGPLLSAQGGAERCASPLHVVLEGPASTASRADPPSAVIELVQEPALEGPLPLLLVGGAVAGGLGSVAGGVAWRRERRLGGR